MNVELVNIRQLPWINRGFVYQILDLWTGLQYGIVGEHNNQRHTDYVCATKEDMLIKLQTANGNFVNNWDARPCILIIDNNDGRGSQYYAAATNNAAHAPDMRRLRDPADIGHTGHFCVWVLDAITGQPGQTLTAAQLAYQTSMRDAVREAYRLAQEMYSGGVDDEMTEMRFNIFGKSMTFPAIIKNDVTFGQIRPILEACGLTIGWDPETATVIVTGGKNHVDRETIERILNDVDASLTRHLM